jgi:autotransporter-associated beta strand protein
MQTTLKPSERIVSNRRLTASSLGLWAMLLVAAAAPVNLLAEANYVYHERTTADPGCGGNYVTTLNPNSAETYPLRLKVEYQFFTDTARVYYTTDGSTPGGTFGVGNVGTLVIPASFACSFGGPVVDVWTATIPAQPAGTVVKYIVSAWHSGGGDEIFGNGCGNCGTENSSSALATVHQYTVGSTTDLYWDSNGAIAGAGATPTGTWDGALTSWSTVFDGTAATGIWTAGRNAIFSAGSDASGAFTVTVTGTQTAGNILVEEGAVTLATGTASIGAGNVTVNPGATLVTDSSLRIAATAGATMTLNGGTVQTINAGAAGTFIDTDFVITLGAAGGTFSYTVPNVLNIVQTGSKITGPGSLTKTGVGVLAFAGAAGNNDYVGGTIVSDGELRIRTVPNTLPITTAMTVTSPGILNLNGVGQKIGSLTGNGLVDQQYHQHHIRWRAEEHRQRRGRGCHYRKRSACQGRSRSHHVQRPE